MSAWATIWEYLISSGERSEWSIFLLIYGKDTCATQSFWKVCQVRGLSGWHTCKLHLDCCRLLLNYLKKSLLLQRNFIFCCCYWVANDRWWWRWNSIAGYGGFLLLSPWLWVFVAMGKWNIPCLWKDCYSFIPFSSSLMTFHVDPVLPFYLCWKYRVSHIHTSKFTGFIFTCLFCIYLARNRRS